MIIYTDGSCHYNGDHDATGGFGVVVIDEENHRIGTYAHFEVGTTNNRQELKAILFAMLNFGNKEFAPSVYSDSAYAVNALNNWMFNWAANDWKTSTNKVVENLDLIRAYYDWYQAGYRINLQKVPGHSGNKWNELADQLANGKVKASYEWRPYGE